MEYNGWQKNVKKYFRIEFSPFFFFIGGVRFQLGVFVGIYKHFLSMIGQVEIDKIGQLVDGQIFGCEAHWFGVGALETILNNEPEYRAVYNSQSRFMNLLKFLLLKKPNGQYEKYKYKGEY